MKLKYFNFRYIPFLIILILSSCAVKREKGLYYNTLLGNRGLLDIYHQKDIKEKQPVLIFIHGGSWNSGSKNQYFWLGRNFARKGIVAVIINYPLAPKFKYEDMAKSGVSAVKWVQNNIAAYGGNTDSLFLMGHSAGGHLAALITLDDEFYKAQHLENPVKGVILNDPFGLDMNSYLSKYKSNSFRKTFSNDPEIWKKASPQYYTDGNEIPFLMFNGGNTFKAIKEQSQIFQQSLRAEKGKASLEVIGHKKHIGMILQMFFGSNKLYPKIINFIHNKDSSIKKE